MFIGQLILLAAIAALGAAKIPPYIHVCGTKNPKFDECVVESVVALTEKLQKGIPELDIPPAEPLYIDQLILADLPNFKIIGTNVKLSGIVTYKVNYFHVNFEEKEIDFDLQFAENTLEGICNVTAKILVPISSRGPLRMTSKNVNAKIRLKYKLVDRNGKQYFYFTSMTTQLDIKDFDFNFKADNFDEVLQEAISQAISSSRQEVIAASKPHIAQAISDLCLRICNKIAKHMSYDELLPDRE